MKPELVSDNTYQVDLSALSGFSISDKEIPLVRSKAKLYTEARDLLSFIHDGSLKSTSNRFDNQLNGLINIFAELKNWSKLNIVTAVKNYCQSSNQNFPQICQILRHWLTDKSIGPDIYDILSYLGKNKILYLYWKDNISQYWNFETKTGSIEDVRRFNSRYSKILFKD